jgi:hypothetical protein
LGVTGQEITLTAQVSPVSPGAGQPTGTVLFILDNTSLGTAAVNPATGLATLTTPIGFGQHSVTAIFSGDANFQSSESAPIFQFVFYAGTQSSVTLQTVRNGRGQVVEVKLVSNVVVTPPGSGVPAGWVNYYFTGRRIASAPLNSSGTAVLRLKPARVLGKFLYVKYTGNPSYLPSVSGGLAINGTVLRTAARTPAAFVTKVRPAESHVSHAHPFLARVITLFGRGRRHDLA